MSSIDLDLIEHLFKETFTVTKADATSWVFTFTSGAFSGSTLSLSGTALVGSGPLPASGTITGLAFSSSAGTTTVTGLSQSATWFAGIADLERSEDDDGEDSHPDDDHRLFGDDDNRFDGGLGNDDLFGGRGADHLRGGAGDDRLDGADDNDDLIGDSGNDHLIGGGGADRLRGGSGRDDLSGGEGNDSLDGGSGKDILRGGSGRDKFVFKALTDSGVTASARDVIADFRHGDRIDLQKIDANVWLPGNQAFSFVPNFTGQAGQLQWDKTATGFLVAADVNGDGLADFSLQLKSAAGTLFASDFIL